MKSTKRKSDIFTFLKRNTLWKNGPTKGGDGGVSVTIAFVEAFNSPRRANKRKQLTVEAPLNQPLEPTDDPYDRAHDTKDGAFLIPAAEKRGNKVVATRIPGAAPRQYPPAYMVSRYSPDYTREIRVATDSIWDWLDAAQRRLTGIAGIGKQDNGSIAMSVHAALALLPTSNDERSGRTLLAHHVTRGLATDEELSRCPKEDLHHERMVRAFLKSKGALP